MPRTPKVQVRVPSALRTTAKERSGLKKAFNTEILRVLKNHGSVGTDITNVDPIAIQMIVINTARSSKKGRKKAAKKARKNKT